MKLEQLAEITMPSRVKFKLIIGNLSILYDESCIIFVFPKQLTSYFKICEQKVRDGF